jgi:hypothetical protein
VTGILQLRVVPYDAIVEVTPVRTTVPDAGSRIQAGSAASPLGRRELPVGVYRVVARKDGYEAVIKDFVEIKGNDIVELTLSLKLRKLRSGIPPGGAFAASLMVPGLGQHLQGQKRRGLLYEAAVAGAGIAALGTYFWYNESLNDYEEIREQLQKEAAEQWQITSRILDLEAEQEDAHNKAETRRLIAILAQVALGTVWAINAVDAGFTVPPQPISGVVFEARPAPGGGQILVRASF